LIIKQKIGLLLSPWKEALQEITDMLIEDGTGKLMEEDINL